MTSFIMKDYSIGYSASGSDIVIKFVLKRRVEQHLLTTFLPSLCILICAQVGSYCQNMEDDLNNFRMEDNLQIFRMEYIKKFKISLEDNLT